ncbi:MAG: succinate dehydrogenase/fumarate reductase flavoprotein subunit, partial [Thermoleophilia bacterium]|nr:succinate dehydrogenase/fumarate reductase flavoprotein subunit [Thermoleophilia bacterium]
EVLREEMADTMYTNCGVFRQGSEMETARDDIAKLRAQFDDGVTVQDKGDTFNTDLTYALEVGSMLEMADVLARCGIERTESRGAHMRLDFPERDDEKWLCHSLATRTSDDAEIKVSTHPVTITTYQPALRSY